MRAKPRIVCGSYSLPMMERAPEDVFLSGEERDAVTFVRKRLGKEADALLAHTSEAGLKPSDSGLVIHLGGRMHARLLRQKLGKPIAFGPLSPAAFRLLEESPREMVFAALANSAKLVSVITASNSWCEVSGPRQLGLPVAKHNQYFAHHCGGIVYARAGTRVFAISQSWWKESCQQILSLYRCALTPVCWARSADSPEFEDFLVSDRAGASIETLEDDDFTNAEKKAAMTAAKRILTRVRRNSGLSY